MKRYRKLIVSVLGILLLLQGYADSGVLFPEPVRALGMTAKVDVLDHAIQDLPPDLPCHEDPSTLTTEITSPCSCCTGDCVAMSACATGHLFSAVSELLFDMALDLESESIPCRPAPAVTRTTNPLLRPPNTYLS